MFGGVSILAVGDLYQLPPVGQAPLFNPVSDCYAQLYGSGVDNFLMIELTEVMRQRADRAFSELLCRQTVAHQMILKPSNLEKYQPIQLIIQPKPYMYTD